MDQYAIIDLSPRLRRDRERIGRFLAGFGLGMEPLDYYAAMLDGDRMVCGGGYQGHTIKCVAVDADYRGEGLTGRLLSHLMSRLRHEGASNIFIFTGPENEWIFSELSFHPVGRTDRAVLLESRKNGAGDFGASLAPHRHPGVNGAIVMNANPFTLGHLYLAETAASRCDRLHVFVVREERSAFPFAVRRRLVSEGTAHIPNLRVYDGGPYIISGATFPTYFLKESGEAALVHAALDVDVFGRHIVPPLRITRRFAGEEPEDAMTAGYNEAMRAGLPAFGVEPVIIPRIRRAGRPVSASQVRRLAAGERWEEVRALVPEPTCAYLRSGEARPVLDALRSELQ